MLDELPKTTVCKFYEPEISERPMEFRLIYKGLLSPEGRSRSHAEEKHRLRKHFHKQLRQLWKEHPELKKQGETFFQILQAGSGANRIIQEALSQQPAPPFVKTWIDHIADDHVRLGGRFVPLVSRAGGFTCSLDILFLRRDSPGNLIRYGGDIDNRIKVLLDGLRMPDTVSDLGGLPIETEEDPFFCLLEDDSLITSITITTDRLITPQADDEAVNDVYLIAKVTVINPGVIFAGNRLV